MATSRGRRKADSSSKLSLVKALAFAEGILKSDRSFKEQHCYIGRGMLVAYDGTLAAGHPITEDIEAMPHAGKLLKALERADETVSVTLNDTKRLSVKAGKFRAVIPCLDIGQFYCPQQDAPIAAIDDRLREGFKAISHIVKDTADQVILASVLVMANSMYTTDRAIGLQFWHGIDLPYMVIPKAAANAILKTDKKLVKFGYSGHSATFWFEDQSWIRTHLFADKWPNIENHFVGMDNAIPVPPSFFAAVRAVKPFGEALGTSVPVYFQDEAISSHDALSEGAVFEVPGIMAGPCFDAEKLGLIESLCERVCFQWEDRMSFCSGNARGVLMMMMNRKTSAAYQKREEQSKEPQQESKRGFDDMEDDIPF
jgi:hypothetical protein